jgi:hypothetical protein
MTVKRQTGPDVVAVLSHKFRGPLDLRLRISGGSCTSKYQWYASAIILVL